MLLCYSLEIIDLKTQRLQCGDSPVMLELWRITCHCSIAQFGAKMITEINFKPEFFKCLKSKELHIIYSFVSDSKNVRCDKLHHCRSTSVSRRFFQGLSWTLNVLKIILLPPPYVKIVLQGSFYKIA